MKKYQIIYADPPWSYQNGGVPQGGVDAQYKTMSLSEIKALPIAEISDTPSVLLLWATFPQIQEALEVMVAWDYQYKTLGMKWAVYHSIPTLSDMFPRKVRIVPSEDAPLVLSSNGSDICGITPAATLRAKVLSSIIHLARELIKGFAALTSALNLSSLPVWVVYSRLHTTILGYSH